MTAAGWAAAASLATGAGTLVLAVATFAAVRSSNRSARAADRAARLAERSLLAGQRPLLVNSRPHDPEQPVTFLEGPVLAVPGGGAVIQAAGDVLCLAVSVRNAGNGLAVLHGWHLQPGVRAERSHPPLAEFTSQILDLYVRPGDIGYWQGTLGDDGSARRAAVTAAITGTQTLLLSLLYGDADGGQRVISQFALLHAEGRWQAVAGRHFNLDRPDPR